MINDLDYVDIKFSVSKQIVANLNRKNICINVFSYENDLVYPVHVLDKKFEFCMDLLLKTDKNKLHYVYIKGFNRFMCNKTKNKNKKHIWDVVYNVFKHKRSVWK